MNTWKLTTLDLFSLGMTIKGAWVYKSLPPFEQLEASLRELLRHYPHLLGRYRHKTKSIEWDDTCTAINFNKGILHGHTTKESPYGLVPKYDIDGFKSGKVQPFSAYYLQLDDGVALVVQCAHAALDGSSFYSLMHQWGCLTHGIPILPQIVNQSLIPSPTALSKEVVMARVEELGWQKIGLLSLLKMLKNLMAMRCKKDIFTIEITAEELAQMKEESGAGANAVLCSLAARRLLEKLTGKEEYTLIQVANLRGHVNGVPENLMGNFSQTVVVGTYDGSEPPTKIQQDLADALASDKVGETVQLSMSASHYGLPYFLFNPADMNSKDPNLFYVNNQLSLKANETDFGTGCPLSVYEAELPDMIKIWQPTKGGSIQIIYRGNAAKIMNRK